MHSGLHTGWVFLLAMAVAFFATGMQASAQASDFQCWPSVKMNLEAAKNFRIHLEEEIRITENSSRIERFYTDLGGSYRLNDYLKVAVTYRLSAYHWQDRKELKGGLFADLNFRYKFPDLKFSYRLRVQTAKSEYGGEWNTMWDSYTNRHRLNIAYDWPHRPVELFAEGEAFISIMDPTTPGFYAWRGMAGFTYRFADNHEMHLQYGIDQEVNIPHPLRRYIMGVGYTFHLKP